MRPVEHFRRAHHQFGSLASDSLLAIPVALTDDRHLIVYCASAAVAHEIDLKNNALVDEINHRANDPLLVTKIEAVVVGEDVLLLARLVTDLRLDQE